MNQIKDRTLIWLLAIVGIVGVFWTQGRQSDCYRNTEENGIETIGVVVSRYRGGSGKPGTGSKDIKFVFFQDGYYIKTNVSGLGEDSYEKAIVGMKYRVKYIPSESQLDSIKHRGVNHGAIIYLNDPIYEEYKNIDSTRCWIKKFYYPEKDKIPGARALEDVLYLIPVEFRY